VEIATTTDLTLTMPWPRLYRPTVWERLLEEFGEKPPVPEGFGGLEHCISKFTVTHSGDFSPDYSGIELRILTGIPGMDAILHPDYGGTYKVLDFGCTQISLDPEPGWEGWPWARNRRERRALKALGKDLWEAVADAEDEVGERYLTKDPGEWNSKFWDFILRPKVPRCTKDRAPTDKR